MQRHMDELHDCMLFPVLHHSNLDLQYEYYVYYSTLLTLEVI